MVGVQGGVHCVWCKCCEMESFELLIVRGAWEEVTCGASVALRAYA